MSASQKKVPAGRNDPRHHPAKKGKRKIPLLVGHRKSNARDMAMKAGDLRRNPLRANLDLATKKKSAAELSTGIKPFDESSLSGPYHHDRKRAKVMPTVTDVKKKRAL